MNRYKAHYLIVAVLALCFAATAWKELAIYMDATKLNSKMSQMEQILSMIRVYVQDRECFPESLEDLVNAKLTTLDGLARLTVWNNKEEIVYHGKGRSGLSEDYLVLSWPLPAVEPNGSELITIEGYSISGIKVRDITKK